MKVFWCIAYGLLASCLVEWVMGIPPSISIFGLLVYPQMLASCLIIVLCFVNRPPPPIRPA